MIAYKDDGLRGGDAGFIAFDCLYSRGRDFVPGR
jgi:hypothetical protein